MTFRLRTLALWSRTPLQTRCPKSSGPARLRDAVRKLARSILLVSSLHCAGTSAEDPPPGAPDVPGKAVLKAVHSGELRQIMRRLNSIAYEREFTQLELDRLRARHIETLVETVGELVRTAETLPEITEDGLNENDLVTFRALANQLYTETTGLRNAVRENNYAAQDAGYRRLRETCTACHNLFRDW